MNLRGVEMELEFGACYRIGINSRSLCGEGKTSPNPGAVPRMEDI